VLADVKLSTRDAMFDPETPLADVLVQTHMGVIAVQSVPSLIRPQTVHDSYSVLPSNGMVESVWVSATGCRH
jgi:hypothetical protein